MIRWFSLIVLTAQMASCGDAYPKLEKLGGNYVYWVATDDLVFIVKGDPKGSNSSIIPESVDLVAKKAEWVFGHVTPYPEELAGAKTPQSALGFFHLNVATGAHEVGMSEKDWTASLTAKGIVSPRNRLKPRL